MHGKKFNLDSLGFTWIHLDFTWIHLDFTWTEGVSKNILGLEKSGKVWEGSERLGKMAEDLTEAHEGNEEGSFPRHPR